MNIREYIFNFVGDKIESRISSDIFDKLLSIPLLLVQGENIGRYGRSIQSISSLRITLINKIFHAIFDLTALLVYLPILFAYNIFMGIIVVLFSTINLYPEIFSAIVFATVSNCERSADPSEF